MRFWTVALVLATGLLAATPALARNTFHDIPVTDAVQSRIGKERLLDVPFYMMGQKHPLVRQDLGVFKTNLRTNAFGKSDQEACQVVFLSALISLQERVLKEGGDAVVDIRSVTKHRDLESATQFRCVAGGFVANVALTGRVVRFAK